MLDPVITVPDLPKVSRLSQMVFLLDFRHVDMLRTEALLAARDEIDTQTAPGSSIGTLLDFRHMTQYSFSTAKLVKRQWHHILVKSAWLIDPSDTYATERARESLKLPYPVGLFLTRIKLLNGWNDLLTAASNIKYLQYSHRQN